MERGSKIVIYSTPSGIEPSRYKRMFEEIDEEKKVIPLHPVTEPSENIGKYIVFSERTCSDKYFRNGEFQIQKIKSFSYSCPDISRLFPNSDHGYAGEGYATEEGECVWSKKLLRV